MNTKSIAYHLTFFFIISLTLSSVQAVTVALIVKNSTKLDTFHEKDIYYVLTSMGFNVTSIDKNSIVDYSQFDMIIIAGRPGNVYAYQKLDSFVANIPVNDHPTIAIDSSYPDDWGWILPVGISTLFSTDSQKIVITNDSTSITNGFSLGETVYVHIVAGRTILDLTGGRYRLTPIASIPTDGDNVVIAAAEPGTELYNNQTNKCRIVFFGVTNPYYWSRDAITLFKNSIEYILSVPDGNVMVDPQNLCHLKYNLPDLTVDSIVINPTSPIEDDNIEIIATIRNIGSTSTNNVTVEFKLDENSIENKTISLPTGVSQDLQFFWPAVRGFHTITIIADPNNVILESDKTNNMKSIDISVSFRPQIPPISGGSNTQNSGGTRVILAGNAEFIGFPEKVEVEVGSKLTLAGKFQSNLTLPLNNVVFTIQSEGLNSSWYSISPAGYSAIVKNDSKDVLVEFDIPKDASIYSYIVTLKATGSTVDGSQAFRTTFSLMLKEITETTTTTTTTTTEIPTTTTTIPEGKPFPFTGFLVFVKNYSIPLAIIILLIIIAILLKIFKVRFVFTNKKGQYTYGKGWKTPKSKLKSFSISSLKTLFTKW